MFEEIQWWIETKIGIEVSKKQLFLILALVFSLMIFIVIVPFSMLEKDKNEASDDFVPAEEKFNNN